MNTLRSSNAIPARKRCAVAVAGALSLCVTAPGFANPTGAQVANGQVTFSRPAPNALNVTNSPGAIINWQGFSIGAGELTRFIQQSPASAVLNRVVGSDPSSILGQLSSNGRVFLVNPHGIVFGAGAVIDTAGLIASTLNISDADFRAGRYRFVGDAASGSIVNQGTIRTTDKGPVFLIAPNIENSGLIETPGGNLVLAAGRSVEITSFDLNGIRFDLQAPQDSAVNLGRLVADGGAAGMFAGTLRHSGEIRANTISRDAQGQIVLSATTELTLESSSVTRADATANGDGGRIIVWSDGITRVHGAISAKGGPAGGDGGFVETSGHYLDLTRAPDVTAPQGHAGAWLIDPYNITIVPGIALFGCSPSFSPFCADSQIGADLITTQLNAGTAVTISTSGDGGGTQAGNIVVAAPIQKTAGGSTNLTLSAQNSITVNGAIGSSSGALGVNLSAGGPVSVNAGIATNGGGFSSSGTSLAVNSTVTTGGGSFVATVSNLGISGAVATGGGNFSTSASNVTIAAPVATANGSFTATNVSGTLAVAAGGSLNTGTGPINIRANNMNVAGALNTMGIASIQAFSPSRPVTLGSKSGSALSLTDAELDLISAGTLRISTNSPGAMNISNSISPAGTSVLSLFSYSGLTQSAGATISVPNLKITTNNANVSLPENNSVSTLAISGANVTFRNVTPLTIDTVDGLGGISGSGNVSLTADSLTLNQGISAGNVASIQRATAGDIDLGTKTGGKLSLTNGELGLISASSLNVGGANTGAIEITNTISNGIDLTLTAGAINVHPGSSVTAPNNLTLTADGMDIQGGVAAFNVTLAPRTAGRNTDLGTETAGKLSLTDTELANVSTTNLTVGNGASGSITVTNTLDNTGATNFALANISNLYLTGSTIAINPGTGISTNNELHLNGDQIDINAALTAGGAVFIDRRSMGDFFITSGAKPGISGQLELLDDELNRITAPQLALGGANTNNLTVGTTLDTGFALANVSGALTLTGGYVDIQQPVSPAGTLNVVADDANIGAAIGTAGQDTVIVTRSSGQSIELGTTGFCGGTLCLDSGEINNVTASGAALRIGDGNSGDLTITQSIAPTGTNTLVLTTGGSIFQNFGSTVAVANLAANANFDIDLLKADNVIGTFAAFSQNGAISVRNAPLTPLTIGSVAGVNGLSAPNNSINVQADDLTINQSISAGGNSVSINPATSGYGIDLGSKPGGVLGLTAAELHLISAGTLNVGGSSNPVTVSAALSNGGGGALQNVSDFAVNAATLDVNAAVSANGRATFTAPTVNLNANVNASDVALNTDSLAVSSATVTGSGNIAIERLTAGSIGLGTGAGGLSIDATEFAALSTPNLTVGGGNTDNLNVATAAGALTRNGNLNLIAGALNIGAFGLAVTAGTGALTLAADAMSIGAATTADSITLVTRSGQNIALGAAGSTGTLGLTPADLGNLHVAGTFTVGNGITGTLGVSTPVSGSATLALNANTLNVDSSGSLAATTAVNLNADNMSIAGSVTAPTVNVAPRSFGRAINLGASSPSALSLGASDIDNISASNALRVGDGAGSIIIGGAIGSGTGTLSLSGSSISESAGGTIDFSSLKAVGTSGVSLANANTVGTLAGSTGNIFSPFTFRNAAPLVIGTVDGTSGVSSTGGVSLTAPDLTINQAVNSTNSGNIALVADSAAINAGVNSSGSTSVSELTAGRGIDLGTKSAGSLGLNNAEINNFGSTNLTFGNSASGDIIVSAPVSKAGSTFNLTTGDTFSVAGAGSFSAANVTVTADRVSIAGDITATSKTFQPLTSGLEIDLGTKSAGKLSFTAAEILHMACAPCGTLSIGNNSAGDIRVSAPISWGSGAGVLVLRSAHGLFGSGNPTDISGPGTLNLVTGTGVGAGSALTTSVGAISINGGAGGINVINNGNLSATLLMSAGNIALNNTGNLTATGSATSSAGSVMLAASGALATGSVQAPAGSVTLSGASVNQLGNVVVGTGQSIIVTATGGDITMGGSRSSIAPGGTINYMASGNVAVGRLDAGAGTVIIKSNTGQVTDANGQWSLNVVGASANVTAATGIDLDTRVASPVTTTLTGTGIVTLRDMNCGTLPLPPSTMLPAELDPGHQSIYALENQLRIFAEASLPPEELAEDLARRKGLPSCS